MAEQSPLPGDVPRSLTPGHDAQPKTPEQQHTDHILREERFRLLVQGVTDYAIFLLDPEGRILCWNTGAVRIFGYAEPEIIGRHYSRLFTPKDQADGIPERELKNAAAEGVARDDGWHVRQDGGRFLVRGTITAIRHENGNLLGFAKVVHDLKDEEVKRELRKRADELLEADRLKDEFLAMLSHELRNPLAPILNAINIMRQDRTDNPVQQQARGMVDRQVRLLARLIDDLLDVSRITRGKIELHKQQVELSVVVERSIESARPLLDNRNHRLSVSQPSQAVWLEADPIRLEQALTNLLNNAAKYTDPGGQIAVVVSREKSEAVIRVQDNGIGITPPLLPRIFDLFIQSDRSLDRSQGGLGIGLTIVQKVVALHGGTVTATSDGPDKGSEFIMRLPVLADVRGPSSQDGPPAVARAGCSLRVLVVDDNVDTAESLGMLLRAYGHQVQTANNRKQALEVAVAFQPDVVLLDIGLPGMDGHEVAGYLRQQGDGRKLSLIAVSGYSQEETKRRYPNECVFDHHLVKPADPLKIQEILTLLAAG